jgi:DNA-binding MarR family transcriptional regulator
MIAYEEIEKSARLAVWQAYLQIHTVVIRLLEARLLAEEGIPLLWYDTLDRLSQAEHQALRLQDLAEAINLSQSGLTRLVDRMVEAGLVERRPCARDRRGLYAAITPAGEQKLAAARPVYLRVLDEHFLRYLSCDEVNALQRVFTNIVEQENIESLTPARLQAEAETNHDALLHPAAD